MLVWTDEAWLQKYGNVDEKSNEEKEPDAKNNSDDEGEESNNYKPSTKMGGKSRVYLDIQIGGSLAGRIEIEVIVNGNL